MALVSPGARQRRGGGGGEEPVTFRHDPRLLWPSAAYLSEEAGRAVCGKVTCPVLAVQGDRGWPIGKGMEEEMDEKVRAAIKRFGKEGGKDVTLWKTKGSHHLHLDLPEGEEVAKTNWRVPHEGALRSRWWAREETLLS